MAANGSSRGGSEVLIAIIHSMWFSLYPDSAMQYRILSNLIIKPKMPMYRHKALLTFPRMHENKSAAPKFLIYDPVTKCSSPRTSSVLMNHQSYTNNCLFLDLEVSLYVYFQEKESPCYDCARYKSIFMNDVPIQRFLFTSLDYVKEYQPDAGQTAIEGKFQ